MKFINKIQNLVVRIQEPKYEIMYNVKDIFPLPLAGEG